MLLILLYNYNYSFTGQASGYMIVNIWTFAEEKHCPYLDYIV